MFIAYHLPAQKSTPDYSYEKQALLMLEIPSLASDVGKLALAGSLGIIRKKRTPARTKQVTRGGESAGE